MMVTTVWPSATIVKRCRLAAASGTDAGYHTGRYPAWKTQPPALITCPCGPVTSNWHRVPAETPLILTASSVPHDSVV